MLDTEKIVAAFEEVARFNNWQSLHTPKNLALAVSVEAAELLAEFQWLSDQASSQSDTDVKQRVGDEVADILMYLVALCDKLGIDIETAVAQKIANNRRRFLNRP